MTEEIEETEDGGAFVQLEPEEDEEIDDAPDNEAHFANIVDEVDQGALEVIVDDLLEKISRDKDARKKRDELYEEGLRRTGLGDDAPGGAQFAGATKVVHPLLVEACVDFAARVTKELLPAAGPVKSKIVGTQDSEKLEKAQRKTDFLNWQLTEQMPEFRGEIEQLTTQLPLGGVQYLKLYWNARMARPISEFIAVDDIYLPFAATNFYSAERKTHVQYITAAEYNKRVKDGMYREVDLGQPEDPEFSKTSLANDKIEGREADAYNEDGLRTVFEVYTSCDIEGDVCPYILSIDKSTGKSLSLYRNWAIDDDAQRELDWIIEFPFIPWRGAYPIGLTHLIGGLAAGSTGALRALLDSAHINNLPTMLKLKGGPNGQTINLMPTEVVEIEGGIGVDDVRKIAMPLPFNQPSQVLLSLLGMLVDAGKGVVQTSFEKLSDTSQQQPVGTTMALIEQGMAVFSSIHSRLHYSMSRMLKVLHRINASYLTEDIVESQFGETELEPADFDGPIDVIPVSDPHIFSETQRFAQMQAVLQRSALLPQLYDLRKTEEMFLRQMRLKPEEVLVETPGLENRDPIQENVAATMGQPIFTLPEQHHQAHIQVHLSFMQSPLFGNNPAMVKKLLPSMVTHLRDHLLQYYMAQSKRAVLSATEQGFVEQDEKQQAEIIIQVQQVIEQEFQQLMQMLPQMEQAAQQYIQPPMEQDNSLQIAQLNVQLQKELQQMRSQLDQSKLAQDKEKFQAELQFKQMQTQLDLQKEQIRLEAKSQDVASKIASDTQKAQLEQDTKIQVNDADNSTALEIAEMEIESGERVAVSSGDGINP